MRRVARPLLISALMVCCASPAARAQSLIVDSTPVSLPLPSESGPQGARYGASVALLGRDWVVGAPGARLGAGRAQLRQGVDHELAPPIAPPVNARFGESVAAAGTLIAVGAPGWRESDRALGVVHLFSTLKLADGELPWLAILPHDVFAPGDQIGHGLAFWGVTLAVPAYASDGGPDRVYLFEIDPTTGAASHQGTLSLPTDVHHLPGRPQVALSDQFAAVSVTRAGSREVLIFTRDAQGVWLGAPTETFIHSAGARTFGAQLAADPSGALQLIVSAPLPLDEGGGTLEVFSGDQSGRWRRAHTVLADNTQEGAMLGACLAWSSVMIVASEQQGRAGAPVLIAFTPPAAGSAPGRSTRWDLPGDTSDLSLGALASDGDTALLGDAEGMAGGQVMAGVVVLGERWDDWNDDSTLYKKYAEQGALPDLGAGAAWIDDVLLLSAPTGQRTETGAPGLIVRYDLPRDDLTSTLRGVYTQGDALLSWGDQLVASDPSSREILLSARVDETRARVVSAQLGDPPAGATLRLIEEQELPTDPILSPDGGALALWRDHLLVSARNDAGRPGLCTYSRQRAGATRWALDGCRYLNDLVMQGTITRLVVSQGGDDRADVVARVDQDRLVTLSLSNDGTLSVKRSFADQLGGAIGEVAYDGERLLATLPETRQLAVFDASAAAPDTFTPPILRAGGVSGQQWYGPLALVRQGETSWLVGAVGASGGPVKAKHLRIDDMSEAQLTEALLKTDQWPELADIPHEPLGAMPLQMRWLGEGGLLMQSGAAVSRALVRTPLTLDLLQTPGTTNDPQPLVELRTWPLGDSAQVSATAAAATASPEAIWEVSAGSGSRWQLRPSAPLAEGRHLIAITAQRADEAPRMLTVSFDVDTTAPALQVLGPPASAEVLRRNPPPIGGLSEPDATVTATVSGMTVAGEVFEDRALLVRRLPGGAWLAALPGPVPEGAYTLTVQSVDAAGNVATVSREARIAAPALSVDVEGLDRANPLGRRPAFRGAAPAGSLVTLTLDALPAEDVLSGEEDTWHFTPDVVLDAGEHQLTIEQTTPAGDKLPPRTVYFTVQSDDSNAPLSSSRCALIPLDKPQRAPQPWAWIMLGVVVSCGRTLRRPLSS